jgi:hypothetical protein
MPFFPNTNEEVSQFLRNRDKLPLHITGGEHEHPRAETISLLHFNKVLLHEPEEMIISVQAGITLEELQSTLKEKKQWIPVLCADETPEQILGAAVATDHYHPRAKTFGMLRTAILGGTFSTTRGEIFKSGSRVVKSVAGYDIHRAFCGSRGHFGVILDLTMKVQPIPEMFYRFVAPLEMRQKLLRFRPACIEEFRGKLLVELLGYKENVLADMGSINAGGLATEEVGEEIWKTGIKELIHTYDKKNKRILLPEVETLLHQVRRVFDPDRILLKYDFVPVNEDTSTIEAKDSHFRVFPIEKK